MNENKEEKKGIILGEDGCTDEFFNELLYFEAVETFGKEHQVMLAIEEMSELIKELSKDYRGRRNVEEIIEEICDVEIMLGQLKIIYKCSDERIKECKNAKLVDLKELIRLKNG